MTTLRVIDTGLRGARANMAFSAALVEGRQQESVPDTLRIFRFLPSVLIGHHQKRDEILAPPGGIELARRLTGGGAVYVDERQFCWELVIRTSDPLKETARRICTAVGDGLSRLGVNACYRPDNDIVVNGRKLCGCAGLADGPVQLYHGTVLVDADPSRMTEVLRPYLGVASPAIRVITLSELLGVAPSLNAAIEALCQGLGAAGFELAPLAVSQNEEAAATRWLEQEFGRDDFVLDGN